MVAELKMVCTERNAMQFQKYKSVKQVNIVAAVCVRLETLAAQQQLDHMLNTIKDKYSKVFNPIPHVDELLTDVYCHIKLKDASKTITTCTYSSP